MEVKKLAAVIGSNPIFARCSENDLIFLIESGGVYEAVFESGAEVLSAEGFESSLGIVASGKLKVERQDDDRTVLLNIIRKGGCFGVSSMFGGEDMQTVITASTRSKVIYIKEENFAELLSRVPQLSLDYIAFLTDRIRFLNSKIRSFTGGNSAARLASMLAESADDEGVCHIVSFAQLARRLDISRASLYRSLASLEETGSIRRDGKTITLVDR